MFYHIVVFQGFPFSFYLYSKEQQSRIEGNVQVRIENYFIIIFTGGLDLLQSIPRIYEKYQIYKKKTCSKVLLPKAIKYI